MGVENRDAVLQQVLHFQFDLEFVVLVIEFKTIAVNYRVMWPGRRDYFHLGMLNWRCL